VKPYNSRPIHRPSSSRSLVAVQDEDVRLHWERKVAKKCEKSKKKKSKKSKKGKSTRELIKENEEMKNEVLKYLVKNKQTILQESSSSSPETSTSEESD
jgi:CelD/BcsL family acetyltransferase involved in cellulose biosynthesis